MSKQDNEIIVTALLDNWATQQVSEEEFVIWGNVFNDIRMRFGAGQYIHTSGITGDEKDLKEGDFVTTRNSVYKLGVKRGEIEMGTS